MIPLTPAWCALLALATPPAQTAPPRNDRCVDAQLLHQNNGTTTTTNATPDGSSSCSSAANSPDVWYLLIPQTSGTAVVTACQYQSATLNPVLSVHSACPGDASNEIACNDDGAGGGSCLPGSARLQFAATAFQPYWLRLAGANGTTGPTFLGVGGVTLPPSMNGILEDAIDVAPGEHFGMLGTTASQLPACISSGGGFYRYTPAVSGLASASTCGSYYIDGIVTVYDGTTMIGCCDDCCSGYQAIVSWNAVAGREYTILIGNFWGPSGEQFRFELSGPPRASETCATAATVAPGTQLIDLGPGSASGASTCDGAPDSAWYGRVVATCDGVLRVSTCGTNDFMADDTGPDTRLSLHSDCPADTSTQLACSNDSPTCAQNGAQLDAEIVWPVTAGDSFVVRLTRDPRASRTMPVLLTVTCEPGDVLCSGDGSATACPCGNTGSLHHGCQNSAGTGGAFLTMTGNASVSSDTVTLHASATTPSATGLYFQGTASVAGGAGVSFGDGLRCAGGVTARLGFRTSASGSSSFGATDGTGASVSGAGGVPANGGTRYYQLWYRDALPYCTPQAFNLSNALRIVWAA